MKKKKLFLLSVFIVFYSTLIMPQTGRGFGLPISWLVYRGEKEITVGIESLFHLNQTEIEAGSFFVNALVVFIGLVIAHKIYVRPNDSLNPKS